MRISKGKKICIICEGYEELEYIEALKNKAVFSSNYEFITINAKSINTIIYRYQEKFQSDSYSLVLIFCDTDKGPSKNYKELKKKVNELHDNDVADDIIIFGNPCTMQIILSHFAEIKLTSQSKTINSKYIEKLTGIKDYKATTQQRKELFGKIKQKNYETMKKNLEKMSTNDKETSSTNILKFIKNFENEDENWINEINKKL